MRREAATIEEERLPESVVVTGRNGRWIRLRSSRVGCDDGAGVHGEDDGVATWGSERDLMKGSTRAGEGERAGSRDEKQCGISSERAKRMK